jgi:hypothetical protein
VVAGAFDMALERAADKVAGAKSDGEGEREYDASEQNAKRQLNDVATYLEVVEDHRCGQNKYEPFDAERD